MDPEKVDNMNALFHQHLVTLELAMSLGRQFEQALASSTAQQPVQTTSAAASQGSEKLVAFAEDSSCGLQSWTLQGPAKQASSSQRSATTVVREADMETHEEEDMETPLLAARKARLKTMQLKRLEFEDEIDPNKAGKMSVTERLVSQGEIEPNKAAMDYSKFSAMRFEFETARAQTKLKRDLKQHGRESTLETEAKEEKDLLDEEGLPQKLRKKPMFNMICAAMILGNVFWVSCAEDFLSPTEADEMYWKIDKVICGWYVFELVSLFLAFRHTRKAITHLPLVANAVIVGLMVCNLWINSRDIKYLSCLSLFRLPRFARFTHISDNATEVTFYATAVFKSIMKTIPLLFLFSLNTFVFSIALQWALPLPIDELKHFETTPRTFHWLFLCAFGSVDKNVFVDLLQYGGVIPWALFVAYTLSGNLIVAKMLTGVLLQVVQKLVQERKQSTDAIILEETMKRLAVALDLDDNGRVSHAEFDQLMRKQDLLHSMANHDVDVAGFIGFTLAHFPADGDLYLNDLIRTAKQFCGFKPVSVRDMMNLRNLIYMELDVLMKGQGQILEYLQALKSTDSTQQFLQAKVLENMQALKSKWSTHRETLEPMKTLRVCPPLLPKPVPSTPSSPRAV